MKVSRAITVLAITVFVGAPVIDWATNGMPAHVPTAQAAPAPAVIAVKAERFTSRERAHWACSDAIERAGARNPTWVRRSAWATVETTPGNWSVLADYSVTNVFGVTLKKSAMCRLALTDGGKFVTLRIENATQ